MVCDQLSESIPYFCKGIKHTGSIAGLTDNTWGTISAKARQIYTAIDRCAVEYDALPNPTFFFLNIIHSNSLYGLSKKLY